MSRKVIIIGASIVLVLSAAVILLAYFTGWIDRAMTSDMTAAGEKFMKAVKQQDYGVIIKLSAPDFLEEIGSTGQTMQDEVNNNDLVPTDWEFTERKIVGTQGQISGTVVFTRGRKGIVELSMAKIGKEWKVSGFYFEEK